MGSRYMAVRSATTMRSELDSDTPAAGGMATGAVENAGEAPHSGSGPSAQQTEAPSRIGLITSLDDLPPVAAYLRRIGARAINFRTAKVEGTVDGYPKPLGGVSFTDGIATVTGTAEAPTPEEAEAIKTAFSQATLPKLVTLAAISDPPPGIVNMRDPNVFVCHDFDGRIVMILQRYGTPEGGKGFVPWTRWSDGKWRKMEPDVLPFFGLPGWNDHITLFLHEGAKAAARVKRILANKEAADFPWREEMRWGHHVGWLGGTFAVDRSDWDALAAKPWKRVVIIADNDQNGMKAAHRIAEKFSGSVFTVTFDQRFREGFDCGDEWPADQFDEVGCYIGPSMDDCSRSAMQATVEGRVEPGQRGRPPVHIAPAFAQRVAYTVIPPMFMFRDRPSRAYSADEFNALNAPFSDAPLSTATKLLGEVTCQHKRLQYDCAHAPGPLATDGRRDWNVFQPTRVIPIKGDPAPWLAFLVHLFPVDAEREEVKKWLATLIAMPAVRMRYGLLLISATQGVGKNTLAHILTPLLGSDNVSFPSEQAVVESQFNDWLARKRLVFVAEIYSGSSRAAYDKMKSVVTDDICRINEKRVKPYTIANWATVIACSNSLAALHLDKEDRRWFVPTVSENLQSGDWWIELYRWLRGDGTGIILDWANAYVKAENYVRTGDRAPGSTRKELIVEGSRSEGQNLAHALAEHLRDWPSPVILRIGDIRAWIARRRGFVRAGDPDLGERRLEKAATILAAMKAVEGVTVWADNMRPKFGATREAVVMNFRPDEGVSWREIKDRLTTIEGVNADEPL